jgi:hypothetical protein
MHVAAQDRTQLGGPGAVRPPRQHGFHHRLGAPVANVRFVACAGEVLRSEHRRQVDQCAWHRGDGDPAPSAHVRALDARFAHLYALRASPCRGCHFRRRDWAFEDTEKVAGGGAAQHRPVTTRSHSGEVPRLDARRPIADPIDTAMHSQQRASAESLLDLLACDPDAPELRTRHHAIRRARDPGQLLLHRRCFRCTATKSDGGPGNRPPQGRHRVYS